MYGFPSDAKLVIFASCRKLMDFLVLRSRRCQKQRMRVLNTTGLTVLVPLWIALFAPAAMGQEAPAAAFPLSSHTITDKLGRSVTYYISHPRQPAPLLLMIQGSGCATILQGKGSEKYSTLYDLLPLAAEGRFAVMAVEKPFANAGASGGVALGCDTTFNEDFTAERWLVALRAAVDDARRQQGVNPRRMVVLGGSEGAVMASLLAGHDSRVTDVIAIGGSGTTQLFDFIAAVSTPVGFQASGAE